MLLCDPIYYGFGAAKGDGRPVVLIPGFLAGDFSLAPLRIWLARLGYRPYLSGIHFNAKCPGQTIDALTHRISRIARERGCPVILIGHSLGGFLARSIAGQFPDLVSQVVCLGAPYRIDPRSFGGDLWMGLRASGALWFDFTAGFSKCGGMECDCWLGSAAPYAASSSIFSSDDEVIAWRASLDPSGNNYRVSGSHCALTVNPDVYRLLDSILTKPEPGA